jgi:hypothetical protein
MKQNNTVSSRTVARNILAKDYALCLSRDTFYRCVCDYNTKGRGLKNFAEVVDKMISDKKEMEMFFSYVKQNTNRLFAKRF